MSRYSNKVEKLLRESNRPSLNILLEKPEDDKEKDDKEGGDDKGFDIFDKEEEEKEEAPPPQEAPSTQDAPETSDEPGGDDEESLAGAPKESGEPGQAEISAKLDTLIKTIESSNTQQDEVSDEISNVINKVYNYKRRLRDSLGNLVSNVVENRVNISYIKNGISNFIFLNEDINDVEVKAKKLSGQKKIDLKDVDDLEDLINKSSEGLGSPREIAKIFVSQINKFSTQDVGLYTLKQALKFFHEFKDKDLKDKFDLLVELFNQETGLSIKLEYKDLSKRKSKYISIRDNQVLPSVEKILRVCLNYFNRFDRKDVALYYLDLAEDYFEDYINPDKKELFEDFLSIYYDYLQRLGIEIESTRGKNTSFKTAAGARASAGG